MKKHHFRFHSEHSHLQSVFGDDWFALKAESFARFFGTPKFIIIQTVVVALWILSNLLGFTHFDLYPFIALNLMFSLQAAYAAPLILLAQTRQADRDKAHVDADARHREEIAQLAAEKQEQIVKQNSMIQSMLDQNTKLTEEVMELSKRVEALTKEMHTEIKHTNG